MVEPHDVEFAKTIMPMFIDSAKSISQLAAGALVLSIGFQEKVLGNKGRKFVTHSLATAWFLFLLAIGTGALYQYTAVHFVDYLLSGSPEQYYPWEWLGILLSPGIWYGLMLLTFFSGATILVVRCAHQLFADREARKPAA